MLRYPYMNDNDSRNHIPAISIVMGVYNGEQYLREAIESILSQTFSDFEFIIIDDCSTDDSKEIISSYNDPRIRFFRNEKNMKISATANCGMRLARGKYIARMDHDDISLPERFQKQFDYLESHPDYGLCGTMKDDIINGVRNTVCGPKIWSTDEDLRYVMFFGNLIYNTSLMMRRDIVEQYQLYYDESLEFGNDYDLCLRFMKVAKVYNIPETLVLYRLYETQSTKTLDKEVVRKEELDIRNDNIESYGFTEDEKIALKKRYSDKTGFNLAEVKALESALTKLYEYVGCPYNKTTAFNRAWFLFDIMNRNQNLGPGLIPIIIKDKIWKTLKTPMQMRVKFIIKCILHKRSKQVCE